jgi:hypothetical protein
LSGLLFQPLKKISSGHLKLQLRFLATRNTKSNPATDNHQPATAATPPIVFFISTSIQPLMHGHVVCQLPANKISSFL